MTPWCPVVLFVLLVFLRSRFPRHSLCRKTFSHALSATRGPFLVLTMGPALVRPGRRDRVFRVVLTPIVVILVTDKNFKTPF